MEEAKDTIDNTYLQHSQGHCTEDYIKYIMDMTRYNNDNDEKIPSGKQSEMNCYLCKDNYKG